MQIRNINNAGMLIINNANIINISAQQIENEKIEKAMNNIKN